MKTYNQTIEGVIYRYYYDTRLKLWTVYQIDSEFNQVSFTEYYYNKKQLLLNYKGFDFKNVETNI